MVYVIVGKKCSGKSTFKDYVKSNFDCVVFETSDYTKIIKETHQVKDMTVVLERFGYDYVMKQIAKKIDPTRLNVVSGARVSEGIDYLKNRFKDVCVVEIVATDKARYQRNLERNREDMKVGFDEFVTYCNEEDARLNKGRAIKSDVIIENNGTEQDFANKIKRLLDAPM